MGVALDVVGQSVVYYVGEVVYVESARGHVGGHEQLREVLAELLHREVALLLREVAVQRLGVVSVVDELVGYLLRLALCAAEYYGENLRVVVNDALQGEVLVLGVDHIINVVHVLGALVAAAHHYLLRVGKVVARYFLDLAAHRGREEQRVAVLGHAGQYLVDAFGEAHVEHLVGLVEHYVLDGLELRRAAVHQVDESSRRGYDYLRAVLQGAYLVLNRRASVHWYDVDAADVLGEVLQVVGYL